MSRVTAWRRPEEPETQCGYDDYARSSGALWVGVLLGSGLLAIAAAIAETPAGPVSTGVVGLGTLAVACGGFLAGRASQHSIEALVDGLEAEVHPLAEASVLPTPGAGLSSELQRSRRYGHDFTIVRIGSPRFAIPSVAASELSTRLRCVDRVWVQHDHVYVLMPECDRTQALRALRRLDRTEPGLIPLDRVRVASFPSDGPTIPALIAALERTVPSGVHNPVEQAVGDL